MAAKLTILKQQQQLIARITESINRGTGLEEMLGDVFEPLSRIVPCNRLSVGLLKPDGHTLVLGPVKSDAKVVLATGYQESIRASSLKPLLKTGKSRVINDLEKYSKEMIAR